MDRYREIQWLKKRLNCLQLSLKNPTILGVCGSYGRVDFNQKSNIDIMFINGNISLIQKEKYIMGFFPDRSIRIHEFNNGNLFSNTISSIVLRILYLTETIPFFREDLYWDLYSNVLNSLSETNINMQDLVDYKLSKYKKTEIGKRERIQSIFPLQVQYVLHLKKNKDIELQKEINNLPFSKKQEIIWKER